MRALEEILKQAVKEGKFKDLSGKGQPLDLAENPLEDPEQRLVNKILANSGFSPAWIEDRREIETELERSRNQLRAARELFGEDISEKGHLNAVEWEKAVNRFREEMAALNKRIESYNLEAPLVQLHLVKVDIRAEVDRISSL
jgi:DnaJ family protein C protein 28